MVVSTAFSAEIYRNDFSLRWSSAAIPYVGWREVPYFEGKFVNDNFSNPYSGTEYQDGWIRGKNSCNCPALVVSDNGNHEAVICNASGDNRHAVLKHRLGNTLTSGQVTAQCDFRAPTDWYGYTRSIRFALGDDAFFSPETDQDGGSVYLSRIALYAGITHDDRDTYHFYRLNQTLEPGAEKGHWYRLAVSLDLDARTWSCAYYDLGTDHPDLETETPETPVYTQANIPMPYDAVTTVSALGITCYCPHGGLDASILSQAAQFDNIRVAHNGVECYRNDFTVRSSRVLDGTLTGAYQRNALVTNTVNGEVYSGNRILVANQNAGLTTAQPIGIDGWRRLNKDGPVSAIVYPGSNDNRLMFDTDNQFGAAAHPLGSAVRTGILRFEAEALVPSNWKNSSILYIKLGDDAHYGGNNSVYNSKRYAQVGFREGKLIYYNGANRVDESVTIEKGSWYRFVVTVDLDAKQYSFTLEKVSNGERVFEKANLTKVDGVDEISCFSLWAYYARVMYDNIKVFYKANASSPERPLYENTFSSRTYYHQNYREGALVGTSASSPAGQDGWKRVDTGTQKVVVRAADGDPVVSFDNGNGRTGYAVHDLGTNVTSGRLVTQVDVKPLRTWQGNKRGAFFLLAGDRFAEGNGNVTLNDGDEDFSKWGCCMVGFSDRANTANGVGLYTNVSACVSVGDGAGGYELRFADELSIDPSHWYRFVIVSRVDLGLNDVELYDMGTAHPTVETALSQSPIAVFNALPFMREAQSLGGLSSLGFLAMGCVANTMDSRDNLFWDNISVVHKPSGLYFILR